MPGPGPQYFQVGWDKGAYWTPDGGATYALNITGWGYKDGGDLVEITHSGTGGHQAFLAAIARVPCDLSAKLDAGYTPRSVGLRFGVKGTISFVKGTAGVGQQIDQIHVIVEEVPYKSSVAGVVEFTATFRSDAITAAGVIISPLALN